MIEKKITFYNQWGNWYFDLFSIYNPENYFEIIVFNFAFVIKKKKQDNDLVLGVK